MDSQITHLELVSMDRWVKVVAEASAANGRPGSRMEVKGCPKCEALNAAMLGTVPLTYGLFRLRPLAWEDHSKSCMYDYMPITGFVLFCKGLVSKTGWGWSSVGINVCSYSGVQ